MLTKSEIETLRLIYSFFPKGGTIQQMHKVSKSLLGHVTPKLLGKLVEQTLLDAEETEGENSSTVTFYRLTERGCSIIRRTSDMKKFV